MPRSPRSSTAPRTTTPETGAGHVPGGGPAHLARAVENAPGEAVGRPRRGQQADPQPFEPGAVVVDDPEERADGAQQHGHHGRPPAEVGGDRQEPRRAHPSHRHRATYFDAAAAQRGGTQQSEQTRGGHRGLEGAEDDATREATDEPARPEPEEPLRQQPHHAERAVSGQGATAVRPCRAGPGRVRILPVGHGRGGQAPTPRGSGMSRNLAPWWTPLPLACRRSTQKHGTRRWGGDGTHDVLGPGMRRSYVGRRGHLAAVRATTTRPAASPSP